MKEGTNLINMDDVQKSYRNQSIDIIKTIAMFAVIGLHTFGASDYWRIANVFYETGVIAIPLFFMVSGYLFLGRPNIHYFYCARKIWRITRFVLILSLVFLLRDHIFNNFQDIHSCTFFVAYFRIFEDALLQRGPLWHCWYLGAMIIIYSLLPIINYIYIKQRMFFNVLFIGCFLLECVVFVANIYARLEPIEMNVVQTFRMWNWLFYFMLGGEIKTNSIEGDHVRRIYIIIGALVGNVIFQETLKPILGSPLCEFFYSSVVVMILVYFIFVFFLNSKLCLFKNTTIISKLFLPVYILHVYVINGIYHFFPIITYSRYLLFFFVSLITIMIAYGLMRIPIVKYVFKI